MRDYLEDTLDRIEHKLDRILRQGELMAASQADLDDAVAALTTEVAAAVAAIQAKVPPTVDLTAEVTAINQAASDLAAAVSPPAPAPPAA